MKNIIYAKDMKCCVCGKQDVALWPTFEPDIPANHYCRICLDKAKGELLRQLLCENDFLKKKTDEYTSTKNQRRD